SDANALDKGDLLCGDDGDDSISGGNGNDTIVGGHGNDTIDLQSASTINVDANGNDVVQYTSVLDGHDIIQHFDADATNGHDVLDLSQLFDSIAGAPATAAARAALVHVASSGGDTIVSVDADGNPGNGFELTVATLQGVASGIVSVGNGAADDIHVGGA